MIYSKLKDELIKKKLSTEGKNMGNSSSKKKSTRAKMSPSKFSARAKKTIRAIFFLRANFTPTRY